ncbi:hypothetical protein KKF34_05045 [Myxococcota bacterium]|nr:hypothetical protein [Myxococcota bacterium]MBU1379202.1 hypothetical protein [Myxococcota bacterium]MBU1496227.1 hypothetical protein [Myxococcota bacterium]
MNILFAILLTATPCNGKWLANVEAGEVRLMIGKTVLKKGKAPARLSSIQKCNYNPAQKLLYISGNGIAWFFYYSPGPLKLSKAIHESGEMAEEEGLSYDSSSLSIFRNDDGSMLCGGLSTKNRLLKWDGKTGTFLPSREVSFTLPASAARIKAQEGPALNIKASPLIKWKADIASGDIKEGEETASPLRLTDNNAVSVWRGNLRKNSFFTFSSMKTPFPLRMLRIFPGNYSSLEALKKDARIKSFYIIADKKVFHVTVPWKNITSASLKQPWIVKFPENVKASCVSIIVENMTAGKAGALSEVTLYTSLDYNPKWPAEAIRAYNDGTLHVKNLKTLLLSLDDVLLSNLISEYPDFKLRKILLEIAFRKQNDIFVAEALKALGWAKGQFLQSVETFLIKNNSSKGLLEIINNQKSDLDYRLRSLSVYLQKPDSDKKVSKMFLGNGDKLDFEARKVLAKVIRRENRAVFIKGMCSEPSGALYWLIGKWVKNDSQLKDASVECLKTMKSKKLSVILRWLFAARNSKSPALIPTVRALYKEFDNSALRSEAIRTLIILNDLGFVRQKLQNFNPATMFTAISFWPENQLPPEIMSVFNSSWSILRKAILVHAGSRCSTDLEKMLISIMDKGERDYYTFVTSFTNTCNLKNTSDSMLKAMKKEKDPGLFALLGDSLARQNNPLARDIILNKVEKMYAQYKKKGFDDGSYAFSLMLRALDRFGNKSDDAVFIKIAEMNAPVHVIDILRSILSKRCPLGIDKLLNLRKTMKYNRYFIDVSQNCRRK